MRRKTPPAKKAPPPSAVAEIMRSEIEDRPFGAVGEWAVPQSEPVPAPPAPLVIPPPPWSVHYDPELDPDHEPAAIEPPSDEDER
jgi:hypothetical protein